MAFMPLRDVHAAAAESRRSSGNLMVKVYKYNNKLAIYLPFDVVKDLALSEGDEIDFFQFKDNTFIFAKKADIASMLAGGGMAQQAERQPREERGREARQSAGGGERQELSQDEIAVLKKLDTLRYNLRTPANVEKMLNADETRILKQLEKERAVELYRSGKANATVYSISRSVYDRFLMRKGRAAPQAQPRQAEGAWRMAQRQAAPSSSDDESIKALEKQGFIVLQTEGEAASVSAALEESIRHGEVIGTRGFNRKFYIMLRPFLAKHSAQIAKELGRGEMRVAEIAERASIAEDGARAVLYYMAESGEIIEKKRELFRLA